MTLQEIVDTIEGLGSDNLAKVGGKFVGGIHLQQVPIEIGSAIYKILNHRPRTLPIKNYLEIGSAAGGSAYLMNYFFKLDNIILIDNNKHKKSKLRKDILKGIPYKEFIGDSHSMEALNFIKDCEVLFDILLIDGDHSYEGVKTDMEKYYPFLDYHGFLIFHDTEASLPVKRYIMELSEEIYQGNPKDMRLIGKFVSDSKPRCGITIFQTYKLRWRLS